MPQPETGKISYVHHLPYARLSPGAHHSNASTFMKFRQLTGGRALPLAGRFRARTKTMDKPIGKAVCDPEDCAVGTVTDEQGAISCTAIPAGRPIPCLFASDGSVIHGPAVEPLPVRSVPGKPR